MAKLLDLRKEYFGDRVISRDDGIEKHQKRLHVVLGQEGCRFVLVSLGDGKVVGSLVFDLNFVVVMNCILKC